MASPRILLVEDDDLNQRLVRAVLARSADPVIRSARLTGAASLAEARAALAADSFDAVLLDLHLPDGNGLSLAAEIRCAGAAPAVVAISGAAAEHEAAEHEAAALAAGCAGMLGKPYEAAQLRALLAAVLGGNGQPTVPAGRSHHD